MLHHQKPRPLSCGGWDACAALLANPGAAIASVSFRRMAERHGDVPRLREAMIRDQAYRGSRYSFGYPACPDLADRAKLVALLEPERIGVTLSEELQLHPEQSTDALVVHHPEAKYFNAR